jgi:hypothetical protein
MSWPVGDQACPPCPTLSIEVSGRGSPPEAETSHSVDPSPAAEKPVFAPTHAWPWNAIVVPSGDQAGFESKDVSWRGTPPGTGTSQIPPRPTEW